MAPDIFVEEVTSNLIIRLRRFVSRDYLLEDYGLVVRILLVKIN